MTNKLTTAQRQLIDDLREENQQLRNKISRLKATRDQLQFNLSHIGGNLMNSLRQYELADGRLVMAFDYDQIEKIMIEAGVILTKANARID